MDEQTRVIEYKCPCCGAGLAFGGETQKLKCEYCDTSFDIDTVRAYNESENQPQEEPISWEKDQEHHWTQEEQSFMNGFQCPSCGGEILTDANTAATFCPFCDNPTILPARLSGGLKPDLVLPFRKTKEDAAAAFLQLCKGKLLLPKDFTAQHRLEKITGMYVPFWLYDCEADFTGSYKATRIHRWSDSRYHYTRTEHFLLNRSGSAAFTGIPMDGSSKMEDAFMESIEPFDYADLEAFDTAYLTGFFADKYDIPSEQGDARIRQRVEQTFSDQVQPTLVGYATVVPSTCRVNIHNSRAKYVLLPVWMLNTKYNGKIYTFAMNGQTGKITGSLPVCRQKSLMWFSGITAAVTALAYGLQWLL